MSRLVLQAADVELTAEDGLKQGVVIGVKEVEARVGAAFFNFFGGQALVGRHGERAFAADTERVRTPRTRIRSAIFANLLYRKERDPSKDSPAQPGLL